MLIGWYSEKQRRIHQILHGEGCDEILWWTRDGSDLCAVTMVAAEGNAHPFAGDDAVCVGPVSKCHHHNSSSFVVVVAAVSTAPVTVQIDRG